jgi:hypothetical protein
MTDVLISAAGAVIAVAVLVDIFRTLANPGSQGWLSRQVHQMTWKWTGQSAWSGPLAMVSVIGLWGVLTAVGWALVYWPHLPDGFSFSDGSSSSLDPTFVDALYLSLVTVSTLGFGDIRPVADWLRIVTPLEGLFGFALLTVVVSWVLQVYPALSRRRELALRLSAMKHAGVLEALPDLEPGTAALLVDGLVNDVTRARVDLGDYAESYYFREVNREAALPAMIGFALEIGRTAAAAPSPEVRLYGNLLLHSLGDFADVLAARFLPAQEGSSDLMASYAKDHGHQP